MLVQRWGSTYEPNKEILKAQLLREGLEVSEEIVLASEPVKDHRHPFTEIRVIVHGEMVYSVKGNQFVLRPGDRVEIPSNTRHSHQSKAGVEQCETLVCFKI